MKRCEWDDPGSSDIRDASLHQKAAVRNFDEDTIRRTAAVQRLAIAKA